MSPGTDTDLCRKRRLQFHYHADVAAQLCHTNLRAFRCRRRDLPSPSWPLSKQRAPEESPISSFSFRQFAQIGNYAFVARLDKGNRAHYHTAEAKSLYRAIAELYTPLILNTP